MSASAPVDAALVVSGDARVAKLLARDDSVVVSAFACRLDGFVNDTITEYANASVYRPPSVCRARLVSTLQDTARQAGHYHLGFTMYSTAAQDEPIELWIGHRQVALARPVEADNRVHLFVAPRSFAFKGGEPIRLVSAATTGPCRIENIVYLARKPRQTTEGLKIISPHVDVRDVAGRHEATITWLTNRPAGGVLRWGSAKRLTQHTQFEDEQACHEAVLPDLAADRTWRYELRLEHSASGTSAVYSGSFKTRTPTPRQRRDTASVSIVPRRPGPRVWPVSVGLPFAKGELADPANLQLLARGRRPVPAQVAALARWPDGSVQWAQVDYAADGHAACRATYGGGVAGTPVAAPLEVEERRTGVTVRTGPLLATFDRKHVSFPGRIALRQPDGTYRDVSARRNPAVTVTDGGGRTYRSGKPDAITIEASGPERACVRIDFRHRQGGTTLFRSRLRVHLFRDSGLIRVLHTFVNDSTAQEFTSIRSLQLHMDLDLGGDVAGSVTGRPIGVNRKATTQLTQTHDNRFMFCAGNGKITRGRRAQGSVDLTGAAGQVRFHLRDFWQNYPKGLAIDHAGITVDLCPELQRDDYRHGGELADRLYYYLEDGTYRLKQGVSRTHEMWFEFGAQLDGDSAAFHDSAQTPPLYSVALRDFNRSGASTRLPDKRRSPFPPYEAWVEAARGAYAEDRQQSRAYGMLNFGDWFGERRYNWGNLEYDTPWCFLQEYLRGGDPAFFTWAEEAVRHLVDVDTDATGAQYVHCVGHAGGYYPEGYRESAIFSGRSSVSHTWVEGLFLYHLLTGDAQTLEAVLATSRLLVGKVLNHYDFTNCRNCGWHLIHLSAAYRATGRRVFLNAARIIVERVLERQRPSGGWDRLMVPGHCHCDPPRHTGNAGFMVGILMTGLKRYHEATGDAQVADAIVRAADYCINTMWVADKSAFRYTCCPESAVGRGADLRILKGVATAYRLSRRPHFRQVLEAGVRSALGGAGPQAHRGVGKSICSPMRGAPQVLVELPGKTSW